MEALLDQVILDNSIRTYLISAAILFGVWVIRKLLSRTTAWLVARLFVNRQKTFDYKSFSNLVIAPIELFLAIFTFLIATERLNYPEVLNISLYKIELRQVLDALVRGALIISLVWLCNRIVIYISQMLQQAALLTPDKSDDQLIMFFRDFFKVIIWIFGVLLLIKYVLGYNLGNLLTGLSIVGAALALAFRESLENLIASFIIFFNKPFTVGDLVKVENVTGTVEKIGLRSTRLRTLEKTWLTVPNKKMVDSIVDNQTLRTQRNVSTRLELDLRSSPIKIKALVSAIEDYLAGNPIIEDHNAFLADTGQQSSLVQVDYFIGMDLPVKDFFKLRQEINLQLLTMVDEAGLELAAENNTLPRKPSAI